ncbi:MULTISPECIES: DNA repair protein RecN [Acidobacterium]|uniref:DNA repair protein RecN n=1 Tax=Acidobacterium capsulatum (strain ATCC 51196 / DSM 11244 / BCRC 80197 / JCM 7670 / NBRC 15755 / NCIMB 13165 / 161) TaxID=240015 RepID=C1F106_ACIC5|nr:MULTISPECIES: DNA repair protein RecN [Acidobacterium]ACO33781.1 DNA repair protein RecN [Acidobacterium capsulatum ATCC 51196]HCT61956.1 DNA repair protein RecN [Acidobacterium sp.]
MLLELRAENYAVIDHAIAVFGPGLNLLTGETGAGKSILVDALALLMGAKASADLVRHGAERAVVACVFESTAGAEAVLEANGIDAQGEEIILRREISESGKGRVFINNQPATVTVLRQLAPELALVHAQSETLGSFDHAQQRGLLDRFANLFTAQAATAYQSWRDVQQKLDALERDEQDRLRMLDLWSFQHKEIGSASLTAGEDDALETERRVLANAEKLYAAAMSAYDSLYESSSSAESALRAASRQLEELARYDERFQESVQQIASVRAIVQDVGETTRHYADGINASPERLAEIEDRLALLDRLKRKYGATLDDVIAYGEEVAQKLAEIENRDETLKSLRTQLQQAESAYRQIAAALTAQRKEAARALEKLAVAQINDLAMKARFEVAVTPSEDSAAWTPHGWDTIECLIATNAGEPLKPLDQIASGGEMSRVLLALKVSVEEGANRSSRKKTPVPRTLVFDEIDIGIGGRAAEAVGQKLKALSRAQQVLCVTHLPQIAAFADQHFLIEKQEKQGRTKTSIRVLTETERAEEIARMMSGATVTDTSRKHAEQMLKTSK